MAGCGMRIDHAIERWVHDFAICAQSPPIVCARPELLSHLLPQEEGETLFAYTQRVARICRAYCYASENASAFEVLGEYQRTGPACGNLSLRVVFTLFVVFTSDAFEDCDPPLEAVIDILVAACDDSTGYERRA
jgi:hypothetical protein